MGLDASGPLKASPNIQYLCTLIRGKSLREFGTLCAHIVNTTTIHMNQIILDIGTYFSLLMPCLRKIERCTAT